ncbi:MAG: IclR family transcriptional regulator [Ardenticatenia bacterium]|nr:IclR family transcriptional regulator [Ardenticatenia bacterium]
MKQVTSQSSKRNYSTQALQRGMKVLDALLESRAPLRLEQICAHTELPKSTAFRVIVNLLQGKYLTETDQGYWLGLKMLRFGALVEERLDLTQQARPFLVQLRDQANETIHLAVLDDDLRVVYLEKIPTQQAVGPMMSRVGSTAPMHCTGLGKAMAAFRPGDEVSRRIRMDGLKSSTDATITDEDAFLRELREIRSRGYAVDNGEFETSVRCVAAPIHGSTGGGIAAVSISGPANRMPVPLIGSSMALQVVETAQRISQALGYPLAQDL